MNFSMKKNDDRVTINRGQVKKIMVGSAMAGALFATAISAGVSVAKGCYQKYEGSKVIFSEVKETGLLPNDLQSRDDSQAGPIYIYKDAYGNYHRIVDVNSFFNDIAAESYDFGLSPVQLAVAFEFGYGYDGEIVGVTEEEKEHAKLAAYHQFNSQKEAHK